MEIVRRCIRPRSGRHPEQGKRALLASLLVTVLTMAITAALVTPAAATSTVFPVVGTAQLTGLYCPSTTNCLAVGSYGSLGAFYATLANGSVSGSQAIPEMNLITALTCPTQFGCYAVGQAAYPNSGGAIEAFDFGVPQPVAFTTGTTLHTTLNSVACAPASDNCVAVGTEQVSAQTFPYTEGVVVNLSNGVPTGPAQVLSNFASVNGIACPTPATCYAVGETQTTSTAQYVAGLLTIASGVAGTTQTIPSMLELTTVSCESATTCWAAVNGTAVEITSGAPGIPVTLAGFNDVVASTCPSSSLCYIIGTSGSTAVAVPIVSDVPATTIDIARMSNLDALSCPVPGQCDAAGSIPNGFSNVGAIMVDALPTPPPTITSVSLGGTAAAPTVSVTGTSFGDLPPTPSPTVSLQCVPHDTSFDYPAGTLSFTDTTGAWSAGTPGSCVGVRVSSWSNTKVVFTPGAGYVYPLLDLGDAFTVSVDGATFTGASTLASAPVPVVKAVTFSGSGPAEQVTVTGSNFGTGQPVPNPTTPLTCVEGDTSHTFGSAALYFLDSSGGWGAGQTGDCLGLTIASWTKTKVVIGFGAFYADVPPVANGNSFTLGILGVTFSGLVGAPPPPTVTAVTFSGAGAAIKVSITGKGFGTTPPSPNPSTPITCVAGDTSFTYNPGVLMFTDITQNWTAGEVGDCIGLTVKSWRNTKVVLGFGADYPNFHPVTSGDSYQLQILGATFDGTAATV